MKNQPKFMAKEMMFARIYNRHPITGDTNYESAYVHLYGHTLGQVIKVYEGKGYEYLYMVNGSAVFVKEKKQ